MARSRRTIIRNLAQLATPVGNEAVRGAAMRALRIIDDPAIAYEGGVLTYVGPARDLPTELLAGAEEIDGRGGTALPGFIDTHTHIPFDGFRESEFNRRLSGETYEQIAASGGGIASTVRATRAATLERLVANVQSRTALMAQYGTTTCEAKSGYGLNLDDELKQLRAIDAAATSAPVRIVATALPAHDIPPELRGEESGRHRYVAHVVEEILPAIAREKLARFCDIFVERGVFTIEDGRLVLQEGLRLGLTPRIHADELSDLGGAALAAEVGAASADHLMYISDEGVKELAASNTVANLLPATSFFLMSERYAPARALIDSGAIVSLSTDCNPGSSMTESMQVVMQLASLRMKMTVEEVITAATINGAHSLRISGETGTLESGKSADIVIIDAPTYLHLVYHFGVNLVTRVVSRGESVVVRSVT